MIYNVIDAMDAVLSYVTLSTACTTICIALGNDHRVQSLRNNFS